MIVRPCWPASPRFPLPPPRLAQPAPAAAAAAEFSADAFRAHVTFLADDLLEGRDTGSRGYEIAARYVATQFAALGLQPGAAAAAGTSRSSSSASPRTARRRSRSAATSSPRAARWSMRASPDPAPLALDGAAGLRRLRARHAEPRLRRLSRARRARQDRGRAERRRRRARRATSPPISNGDKRRMAAARGAVGMITIRTRADSAATPWARAVALRQPPGTTWLEPDGTPFADGAGLRFSATLDEAGARAAVPRRAAASSAPMLDEAARAGARPRGFALRARRRGWRASRRRRRASRAPTWSRSCPAPIRASPANMCC